MPFTASFSVYFSLFRHCHILKQLATYLKIYYFNILCLLNRGGGGQVVSVFAFYSNDPSSNPAYTYSFSVKFLFEKNKNKQKEAWLDPLKKQNCFSSSALLWFWIKQSIDEGACYKTSHCGRIKNCCNWDFWPGYMCRMFKVKCKILLVSNWPIN